MVGCTSAEPTITGGRCSSDGSQEAQIGGNTTSSTLCRQMTSRAGSAALRDRRSIDFSTKALFEVAPTCLVRAARQTKEGLPARGRSARRAPSVCSRSRRLARLASCGTKEVNSDAVVWCRLRPAYLPQTFGGRDTASQSRRPAAPRVLSACCVLAAWRVSSGGGDCARGRRRAATPSDRPGCAGW
jgi:hypothetical protein